MKFSVKVIILVLLCMLAMPFKGGCQGVGFNSAAIKPGDDFVLVVSSYPLDNFYQVEITNALYNRLSQKGCVVPIRHETMLCTTLSDVEKWNGRFEGILNKYIEEGLVPSLLVLIGQEAWTSYLSCRNPQVHSLSVMPAMCSRNFIIIQDHIDDISMWMPENHDIMDLPEDYRIVGGVIREYDFLKNVDLLYNYYPNRKNIVFVADNTCGGITLLANCSAIARKNLRVKFTVLDGRRKSLNDLFTEIRGVDVENSALMIGSWKVDYTGRYYETDALMSLVENCPDLPVISLTGRGFDLSLGGYMPKYNNSLEGEMLADQVYEYLNGRGTGRSGIRFVENGYRLNYEMLSRFPEFEKNMPANAEIVGRQKSVLEEYKVELMIIAMAFFLLSSVVAVLIVMYMHTERLKGQLQIRDAELRTAKTHAENSNRMKSAFLANMSHEIRTPLNAIVGFSEILTQNNELTVDEKNEISGIITNNANLLLKLINGILDLSRLESGKTKYEIDKVDLVDVCRTALLSAKSAYNNKKVEYYFKSDVDSLDVMVDEQRLQQVLLNLLSNASKFTQTGHIEVEVEPHEEKREVWVKVSDTGTGVPKEQFEAVFERFEKLDEFKQGTGLGLSMCKTIIEHFGGRIWIDPDYHDGARFVFSLPILTNLVGRTVEFASGETNI